MQWLRRSFITGFFVTVPLIVSVAALVWAFRFVDGFATPIATRVLGRAVPGVGVLVMATLVLGVGALAPPTSSASGCCSAPRAGCSGCRCSRRSTRRCGS